MSYYRYLVLLVVFGLVVGCNHARNIEKGELEEGLSYTIIHVDNDAPSIKPNMIVKALQNIQIGDSVVLSMDLGYPQYQKVLGEIDARKKFDLLSVVLLKARKGDTILSEHPVYKMKQFAYVPLDDSLTIITKTIILDVFSNMEDAQADRQEAINSFIQKEKEGIKHYLDEHKISAEETNEGVFVEKVSPAKSNATTDWLSSCKDSCVAIVRYEGKIIHNGNVFDENYRKKEPFEVKIGTGQVIEGFEIAVKKMQVGETIKAYIPSMLAYKERGTKSGDIKAFEAIVFQITLEKVLPLNAQ